MSWERGYRRPGDGVRRPHLELRRSTAFLIAALAQQVRRRVRLELADTGLTWPDYVTLTVLVEVHELSQQALAERTLLDRTRVAELVDGLESSGLVERRRAPSDLRLVLVTPTPGGRDVLSSAAEAVQRAESEALRSLARRERERLRTLLDRALPDERPARGGALTSR